MLILTNRDFLHLVEKCRTHLLTLNITYERDWYCGDNIVTLLGRMPNEEFNSIYIYDLESLSEDVRNEDISAPYLFMQLEKVCMERNKCSIRDYLNNRLMY